MSLCGRVFVVFLFLTSSACNGNAPKQKELSKVDCIDQQGIWIDVRFGSPKTGHCVTPTADAGHSCRSKSDCQSACVIDDKVKSGQAATGQCFGWSDLTSHCVNLVDENGLAEGIICYD